MQFKTKLILLACCLSVALHGQTIQKGSFFNVHGLGICSDTTEFVDFDLDLAKGELRVYSWTGLYGKVDKKGEKKDSGKSRSGGGGLLRGWEVTTGAAAVPARPAPDAGCLAERIVKLDDLAKAPNRPGTIKAAREFYGDNVVIPFSQLDHFLVYPFPLKPEVTYSFAKNDKCGGKQVSFDTMQPYDAQRLATRFPTLDIGKEKVSSRLTTAGEGLLGNKNVKTFIETTQFAWGIDTANSHDLKKYVASAQRPNQADVFAKLGEYLVWANDPTALEVSPGVYFGLLRGNQKGEKWASYQHFRVVKYNSQGELLQISDVNLEFLKTLRSFSLAYNKAGEPAGVLLVLSDFTALGAKSLKDPKDNNHVVYYFGLDGREKFHYTIEHGEGDNPRGFNPVLVVEDGGQLLVWNANSQKVFSPKIEVVTLNDTGKVDTRESDVSSNLLNFWNASIRRTDDGHLLLTYGSPTVRANSSTNTEAKDGSGGIALVTTDFKVLALATWANPTPYTPDIHYLGKFGDNYQFAIGYGFFRNEFVALGPGKKTLTFPGKDEVGLSIPRTLSGQNYTVDRTTNKLYAYYTSRAGNGLLYVLELGL